MYLEGGHFNLAAQLAQEMEDYAAASRYYVKAGDLKSAAEMELQRDNREAAARLFSGARLHTHAAEIYLSLELFEAAAQQYERAQFHEKAASLFARAGKPRAAARLLEGLIRSTDRNGLGTGPSEAERSRVLRYHRMCGELLQSAGEHGRAAVHLERALCLEAAAAAWQRAGELERAADLLLRLQKPEAAYGLLQRAGRDLTCLPPEVQAAILARGGRHQEAAEVLERAGSHFAAAEAWAQSGDIERAAALFEKEGDPERASAHYLQAGQPGEAARVLEAAGRPRRAAELYQEAGRPEDAARMLQKANDPVAAAMIHYDRGDHDAVIRALQRLRPDDPGYRNASVLLGQVFFEQGLHTLAVDRFLAAIAGRDVDAETLDLHYRLARAHEASRRPREAVSAYRRVLAYDYHHEDVLERMRQLEEEIAAAGAPAELTAEAAAGPARYRIERSLGIGKLGEVFAATDTVLRRKVALRRVHEGPGEAGKAARFLREAASAAGLNHPNIVTTFDTGVDRQGAFIVSALAEGNTLRSLLDRKVRFEVNRIVEIGGQILEALEHAHERGVPHRGISPGCVFVSEEDHVAVADFGMAIRLSDLSSEELASGTRVRYTAPETLLRQRVDERTDLYAFGILLYEMAVGHPPFRGAAVGHQQVHDPVPAPGQGGRSIPRFLKKVILRCLEKRREDRYPSARAALADLRVKEIMPGVMVADRYEVMAEVGRGGMGTVFRARDAELDETVALKFLAGRIRPEMIARQVREIKIARAVVHPSVVRVFTLEKWGDHRFLVMEYIDGVALPRWVERSPAPGRADRLRVGIQVARALQAAHEVGVIHRDIKPENILIDASGETKVLDFGIARSETDDPGEGPGKTILGSPMYVAPERIQGRPLDRRSDLYALGAVLYFLFTGTDAFPGRDTREILLKHLEGSPRPPHEIDPTLPRPISQAILRCLALDPEERFASGAELAEALASLLPVTAAEGKAASRMAVGGDSI